MLSIKASDWIYTISWWSLYSDYYITYLPIYITYSYGIQFYSCWWMNEVYNSKGITHGSQQIILSHVLSTLFYPK